MLQQLVGEGVGDQQLERVVQATMLQYDTDGDWRLDFREFVALMNRWAAGQACCPVRLLQLWQQSAAASGLHECKLCDGSARVVYTLCC